MATSASFSNKIANFDKLPGRRPPAGSFTYFIFKAPLRLRNAAAAARKPEIKDDPVLSMRAEMTEILRLRSQKTERSVIRGSIIAPQSAEASLPERDSLKKEKEGWRAKRMQAEKERKHSGRFIRRDFELAVALPDKSNQGSTYDPKGEVVGRYQQT